LDAPRISARREDAGAPLQRDNTASITLGIERAGVVRQFKYKLVN
jgi:hypothetical protein